MCHRATSCVDLPWLGTLPGTRKMAPELWSGNEGESECNQDQSQTPNSVTHFLYRRLILHRTIYSVAARSSASHVARWLSPCSAQTCTIQSIAICAHWNNGQLMLSTSWVALFASLDRQSIDYSY